MRRREVLEWIIACINRIQSLLISSWIKFWFVTETKTNWNEIHWYYMQSVGFEVLTAVVMKNSVFWAITPCSPLKVNGRFGETSCLHLQGRRISRIINQRERRCRAELFFLRGLFFESEYRDDMFLRKHRSTFTGLHGVISQKTDLLNWDLISLLQLRTWRLKLLQDVATYPLGSTASHLAG
jgi:hypothetical protein